MKKIVDIHYEKDYINSNDFIIPHHKYRETKLG